MTLDTLWEYKDIILIVLTILLALIARFFQTKAHAMERYVEANRATREFIDVVMISLEDMTVNETELDAIKEKYCKMRTTVTEFFVAIDNQEPPEEVLEASTQKILTG
ncbi:MAG: hypothetical protein WC277_11920 [Bacilli bacterium]|jgi:hypothetical protein